jgi:hypothetical protein
MAATLLAETELEVVVDHRLLGVVDEGQAEGERPASPHSVGHWFAIAPGKLYVESTGDVIGARLRLEAWDGPPSFDAAGWDRHDETVMELASGVLGVDQIAAGGLSGVFELPGPGAWQTRVAWREAVPGGDESADDPEPIENLDDPDDIDDDLDEPEAWALLQFWPTSAG